MNNTIQYSEYPVFEEFNGGFCLWWDRMPFIGVDLEIFTDSDHQVPAKRISITDDKQWAKYEDIHQKISYIINKPHD